MNEPKPTPPTMTDYGLPEREDPLRFAYRMTDGVPGRPFRDPTNGKLYVKLADGSLRRAQVVKDADGKDAIVVKTREQRARGKR